ncbi:MAG: orotidine-5'-phosphate decarboxylase [Rhodospirillaceae bacterium]|nr:orotidine-5'-phosphate decarboxylase [Rhodospirillaceae bacterium]
MNAAPARPGILVALDTSDLDAALRQARAVAGLAAGVKLGLEFFVANGPQGVRRVVAEGRPVFLDLKLHDIPNTVAGAVRAAAGLGAFMLNLHAAGGATMLREAAKAARHGAAAARLQRPLLIAVTVLTSLSDEDLLSLGHAETGAAEAVRLARLARDCGLDGVVCSPLEIADIRSACGPDFTLVVPGVRPYWAATGDQKRVTTPAEAARLGADYLVIGRPITAAPDPAEALRRIQAEIAGAG